MAVVIRMTRLGKQNQPFFRIVAIDSKQARDAKYIELIGTYNPLNKEIKVNEEIALKWLSSGAKPSETVKELFSKKGITQKFHESKQKK